MTTKTETTETETTETEKPEWEPISFDTTKEKLDDQKRRRRLLLLKRRLGWSFSVMQQELSRLHGTHVGDATLRAWVTADQTKRKARKCPHWPILLLETHWDNLPRHEKRSR